MRTSEDWSGPLATCTGNTGRSPLLTRELVPVDWHGLPVQVTNGPDRSSEVLITCEFCGVLALVSVLPVNSSSKFTIVEGNQQVA